MRTFIFLFVLVAAMSCFQYKAGDKQSQAVGNDAALAAFQKQEHRFSIEACKLYYNEQQLVLDSLHLLTDIVGDNYARGSLRYYRNVPLYFVPYGSSYGVKRLGIKLSHDPEYQRHIDVGIPDLNTKDDSLFQMVPVLDGYVMIDGQLIDANTDIEEFNERRVDEGLPLYTSFMGSLGHFVISYGGSYCTPAYNFAQPYLSDISLIYNLSSPYKDPGVTRTTLRVVHYDYSKD